MTSERMPLDVACPKCGQPVGRGCETSTGWPSKVHASRWKAAGVCKPTLAQIRQAYAHEKQLQVAQREEVLADNRRFFAE